MTSHHLAPLLLGVALAGCGLFKSEQQPVQEVKTREAPGRPSITIGELDRFTKNYADRLVARVSTACDAIKKESEEQRRSQAHRLKLTIALAAYEVVTSPGSAQQFPAAAQHMIDLMILTELESVRWVDEHAARDVFGDKGAEKLVEAFTKCREDVRTLCGRVMSAEQMDQLRTLVLHWRQENPTVEWLSQIRFDVIGDTADLQKGISQSFNPLEGALQRVDDIRVTADQALFYFKRLPTLLDWTTEATISDAMAIPKVDAVVHGLTDTMGSVSRATGALQQLLQPSSQEPAINSTITNIREALEQGEDLVKEVRALQTALQPYLEKPKETSGSPKKSMDVEAVVSRLDDTTRDATALIRETRGLTESPSAMRNVDDVLNRATQAMSQRGQALIDHATWRAIELALVVAVLVAAFKGVSWWLKKRRQKPASSGP
jgi:hypothetical protein